MRRLSLLLLLLSLLAACNSTAPRPASDTSVGPVEVATSRQTSSNTARLRAKAHADLGRVYLLQGNYEVALEEAKTAIAADPSYAVVHDLNALIHMALRKNDQAETSFRDALRISPNDPEINNDYGWFLCQTDRPRDALPFFRQAFSNPLYKTPGTALTNAGLCSRAMGDDKQAEEYLLRAFRGDHKNAVALFHLTDIAYRDGRFTDARQRMTDFHALRGEPTAESAWLALRIDRKLGDREGEARYTGLLRRKYRDSEECLKLTRGEFD